MSNAWKCPKCGTVLQKPDYWQAMPFSTMVGTVRCGGCGVAYGAGEIQSGRYDVGAGSSSTSSGDSVSNRAIVLWILSFILLLVAVWWRPFGHLGIWWKLGLSIAAFIVASTLMTVVDELIKKKGN